MERQLFFLNAVWNALEIKHVPNGKNVAKNAKNGKNWAICEARGLDLISD